MTKGVKGSTKKLDYDYVKKCFEERGYVLLETSYINNSFPMRYVCICGNKSKVTIKNLLNGQKCRECGYKHRKENRFAYEDVYQHFKSEGCELLEKDYKNSREYMLFKCSCGNVDKVQYYFFKKGRRCKPCGILKNKGQNHPNWNPDLTDEDRLARRDIQASKDWSYKVKQRDDFTCQRCGDNRGGNLVSHHIESYSTAKDLRFDLRNGITLCVDCHKDFHGKFGYGKNTLKQFNDWMRGE